MNLGDAFVLATLITTLLSLTAILLVVTKDPEDWP